jgi:hypothetical protein
MTRKSLWPLLLLAACGMGPLAGEGGGADNLPSAGAGPYLLLPADFDTPADEPYVHSQQIVSLLDPAVLPRGDGGFDIYYTKLDAGSSEIWRVFLPAIDELIVGEPEQVLVADSDWEQESIGGACLLREGEDLLLYYYAGDQTKGIGLARSRDGGQSFSKEAGNPLLVDAVDPFVALHKGRWYMVHGDPEGTRLLLREGSDGLVFSDPREVLRARSGVDTAFDQLEVRAPALDIKSTLEGGLHFGVFYSGLGYSNADDPIESIGYAGSLDGENWQRSMAGEPILDPGPTGAGGAAPVVGPSKSLLFFHQLRQGRGRIAVATSP